MAKIPGDTGHPYRLNKFVEYQHKVPPIHPVTLLAYAKRHKLRRDDLVWLSWLQSVTYCEITALYLFEQLDDRGALGHFWEANKPKLIFNSARRYAKSMDWFVPLVQDFDQATGYKPYEWVKSLANGNGLENYNAVSAAAQEIRYTGRFASDLFLEMLMWSYRARLLPIAFEEPVTLDWKKGSNLTSGLLNVFYADEAADEFDRSGKIPAETSPLDVMLRQVQKAVRKAYPEQESSLPLIQTKLCSFRNLFKGTRYGGYHHDRQLENLRAYQASYPDYPLWEEIFKLRRKLFPATLLGEVGWWDGIRKERKKLWLTTGQTGVEEV